MPIDGLSSNDYRPKPSHLPQDENGQDWLTRHVKKGDTLWDIVKTNYGGTKAQINMAVKAVEENNNIDRFSGKIIPGQKIKLLSVEQLSKIYPELIDVD